MQSDKHSSNDQSEQGFFDRPSNIQWMLRVFYSICAFLVIIDFFIHRHIETAAEKLPAFYAIYGFVACVILVLIANQMRKLLIRDEHYYENTESSSGKDSDQ